MSARARPAGQAESSGGLSVSGSSRPVPEGRFPERSTAIAVFVAWPRRPVRVPAVLTRALRTASVISPSAIAVRNCGGDGVTPNRISASGTRRWPRTVSSATPVATGGTRRSRLPKAAARRDSRSANGVRRGAPRTPGGAPPPVDGGLAISRRSGSLPSQAFPGPRGTQDTGAGCRRDPCSSRL